MRDRFEHSIRAANMCVRLWPWSWSATDTYTFETATGLSTKSDTINTFCRRRGSLFRLSLPLGGFQLHWFGPTRCSAAITARHTAKSTIVKEKANYATLWGSAEATGKDNAAQHKHMNGKLDIITRHTIQYCNTNTNVSLHNDGWPLNKAKRSPNGQGTRKNTKTSSLSASQRCGWIFVNEQFAWSEARAFVFASHQLGWHNALTPDLTNAPSVAKVTYGWPEKKCTLTMIIARGAWRTKIFPQNLYGQFNAVALQFWSHCRDYFIHLRPRRWSIIPIDVRCVDPNLSILTGLQCIVVFALQIAPSLRIHTRLRRLSRILLPAIVLISMPNKASALKWPTICFVGLL